MTNLIRLSETAKGRNGALATHDDRGADGADGAGAAQPSLEELLDGLRDAHGQAVEAGMDECAHFIGVAILALLDRIQQG